MSFAWSMLHSHEIVIALHFFEYYWDTLISVLVSDHTNAAAIYSSTGDPKWSLPQAQELHLTSVPS